MADRETLYRGLSHAAWGYFFLRFDFNLNNVSIFPRFVGFLLLLSAINKLSGERRDLSLLRPLCILLSVWNGVDWLLSWIGGDVGGHILFLDVLIEVAGLYFHFQFITDMAALAEQYQSEDSSLDQRLRHRRTAYIVLSTVAFVIMDLPVGRFEDQRAAAVTALAVILLIVALFIMKGLFDLRRCFREEAEDQPEV